MISYAKLNEKLKSKGLTKTALAAELGISSRTIAKNGCWTSSLLSSSEVYGCCTAKLQNTK